VQKRSPTKDQRSKRTIRRNAKKSGTTQRGKRNGVVKIKLNIGLGGRVAREGGEDRIAGEYRKNGEDRKNGGYAGGRK